MQTLVCGFKNKSNLEFLLLFFFLCSMGPGTLSNLVLDLKWPLLLSSSCGHMRGLAEAGGLQKKSPQCTSALWACLLLPQLQLQHHESL